MKKNLTQEDGKKFAVALQAIRTRLNELDEELINPKELQTDKVFLNNYGKLIDEICLAFQAETLNVFFQQPEDPLLLDGVLSIRNDKSVRLQFIKNPIDNFTVAGYTFINSKVVNVADLYVPEEEYSELEPTRNKEIDRRLKIITKQCLSVPIVNSQTRKTVGCLIIVNYRYDEAFPELYVRGINALAILIGKSFQSGGVFSRVIDSTKSIGKGGFATSLAPAAIDVDSNLSAEDFTGVKEGLNEKIDLALKLPKSKFTTTSIPPLNDDEDDYEEEEYEDDEDEEEEEEDEEIIERSPQASSQVETKVEQEYIERRARPREGSTEYGISTFLVPDLSGFPPIKSIYDFLVFTNEITKEQLAEAIESAKQKQTSAEDILRNKMKVSTERIGISMAAFYNCGYLPYSQRITRPADLLSKIKQAFLVENRWLPVIISPKPPHEIIIATPDPIHAEVYGQFSQLIPGKKFKIFVCTEYDFRRFTDAFFRDEDALQEIISDMSDAELSIGAQEIEIDNEASVSEDEIVKLVNKIIHDAYYRRASDIHIEPFPGNMKTRVRFRIDGDMVEYVRLVPHIRQRIINRIKIMADMKISENRIPQDGKIQMAKYMRSLDIELRVATYPVAGGSYGAVNLEDAVLRILATGEPIPLEKLGFNAEQEKRMFVMADKPYGIIFVCGPTGSGKTTTLHSVLHYLNREDTKILTAEDPVEIIQNGLRQVQINRQAGLTFENAMRAFLRADPDVIMVGEMRDRETVAIGIEASLTGHLVLATLHTNSAPEAITRLLEMGMDPHNFADAMLGILAQRLAKRHCQNCHEKYQPSPEELDVLLEDYLEQIIHTEQYLANPKQFRKKIIEDLTSRFGEDGKLYLYKPVGCDLCLEGYKGRVGLYELLTASTRLKVAIKNKKMLEELTKICIEDGMDTLKMDGIQKCFTGVTDIAQVKLVCMR